MNFRTILLALSLCIVNNIFSQENNFSVALIPDELRENANAVVRFDHYTVDIASQREMTIYVEKAVTIYNELGDGYSDLSIYYDKRRTIKSVKMVAFDGSGKEIKKIKKGDFKDYSATGNNLFSDSRLIHYDYTPTTYPYTMYYSYEVKTSNTAFISGWIMNGSYYKSVQNSKFTIKYPSDVKLIKSERNFEGYDVIKKEGNGMVSYEVSNSFAIEREPYTPRLSDVLPFANFGINKFNLEGVDGEAESWEEFGKWYYQNLIKGRMELPDSAKKEIKEIVAGISEPVEKAKLVYEYVQNKVRYISVQVGVGGFTPMLAKDVDALSYGDCKALTNYTASLLEVVGIKSYHALIYGDAQRKRSIDKDVVSQQGNHMVLFLPMGDQEIWLECTSQKNPFGDGGDFTDDRNALIITPEGGEIKRTRVYKDEENHQYIKGKYTLNSTGDIKGEINMECSGTQFDNHLHYEGASEKELDKYYKEFWDNINNMTIDKIAINNNKKQGKFEESVSFSAENYGVISGDRMIFPLNAFNVMSKAPKRVRNRKLPVEVTHGFFDVDEVEIELPEGFVIEAINDDKIVDSEFGSYQLSIKQETNSLKLKREFLLRTGNYPKESYDAYRNFWREVVRNDKSKIVLIKK